jgi:MYXO-CTERM domain-containing protein
VVVRSSLIAGLLLAGSLLAFPAQAEPTPGNLYLTSTLAGTAPAAGAGVKNFQFTDVAPTAATDSKAYPAASLLALSYYTDLIFLSCEQPVVFQPRGAIARMVLFKNGRTTAIGTSDYNPATRPQCMGPSSVLTFPFSVSTQDTAFSPADTLIVEFLFWWSSTDESVLKNGHILVNSAAHPSRVTAVGLPVPGGAEEAGPVLTFESLEGDEVHLTVPATTPTTALNTYNWATTLGEPIIDYWASVTAGTTILKVVDAAGATLLNETLMESGNGSVQILAEPGEWTISIETADFTGLVMLNITAPAPDGSPEGPGQDAGPDDEDPDQGGEAPTNGVDDTGAGDDKGSPGIGPMVVLLVVALAALVARRRA